MKPRALFIALRIGFPLWLSLASLSGCTRVRPYQRELLAHPTMLLSDSQSPAEAHVHAIQEGASGGGSGAEGGCGCN